MRGQLVTGSLSGPCCCFLPRREVVYSTPLVSVSRGLGRAQPPRQGRSSGGWSSPKAAVSGRRVAPLQRGQGSVSPDPGSRHGGVYADRLSATTHTHMRGPRAARDGVGGRSIAESPDDQPPSSPVFAARSGRSRVRRTYGVANGVPHGGPLGPPPARCAHAGDAHQ